MESNAKPKLTLRKCPSCNQDIEVDIGLNKTNIKRLFRKPTFQEVIILFILFVAIASFLGYRMEINAYKTYMNENCTCNQFQNTSQISINFSEFELQNKDSEGD